jgi:hypothetical protein
LRDVQDDGSPVTDSRSFRLVLSCLLDDGVREESRIGSEWLGSDTNSHTVEICDGASTSLFRVELSERKGRQSRDIVLPGHV